MDDIEKPRKNRKKLSTISANREREGPFPDPSVRTTASQPTIDLFRQGEQLRENNLDTSPAEREAEEASASFFVIMPFSEPWSDGTYDFIRKAFERLDIPPEQGRLYRADEIASPGQISNQIKEAIDHAQVVIADITGMNPNVMRELGYADGRGKAIVILNQDPDSSPFDMVDRRQVAYHASPTDAEEDSLVRHLNEARPGTTS